MPGMKILGDRVKKLRGDETFEKLAERLTALFGRKVKYQSLQQLELGEVEVPRYVSVLPTALGTTIDYLTGRTDDPSPSPKKDTNQSQRPAADNPSVQEGTMPPSSGDDLLTNHILSRLLTLEHRLTLTERDIDDIKEGAPKARPQKPGRAPS